MFIFSMSGGNEGLNKMFLGAMETIEQTPFRYDLLRYMRLRTKEGTKL